MNIDELKKEVDNFIDKYKHWTSSEAIAASYVGYHMVNVFEALQKGQPQAGEYAFTMSVLDRLDKRNRYKNNHVRSYVIHEEIVEIKREIRDRIRSEIDGGGV